MFVAVCLSNAFEPPDSRLPSHENSQGSKDAIRMSCMSDGGSKEYIETHLAVQHNTKQRASLFHWAQARFYSDQCAENATTTPESETRLHPPASIAIKTPEDEKEWQGSIDPITQPPAASAIALVPSNRSCTVCHEFLETDDRREIIQHQYRKHGMVNDFDQCAVPPEREEPAPTVQLKTDVLSPGTACHDLLIEISTSDVSGVRDDIAAFGRKSKATYDTVIGVGCENVEDGSPDPCALDTVTQARDAERIQRILMNCIEEVNLPHVE